MNDIFKVDYLCGEYIEATDIIIGGMSEFDVTRERLKALRKELGISQAELAEAANKTRFTPGLLQSRVSDIERGLKDALPTFAQLAAISEVLQTNPGYLLGVTDDPMPQGCQSDQVVVSIEDPDRRAKIQAIAESMRTMPDEDIALVAQLVVRIAATADALASARKIEIEENDRLWTSVFMLAGAHETQRLLDAGLPASDHFRRMIKIAIAREQQASNQGA